MKTKLTLFFIAPIGLFFAAGMANAATDITPPTAPKNISVSVNQYAQISITWGGSTDNVGVVGYYIYRNGALVMSSPSTSALDRVAPGIYVYTVAAFDAAGNVSPQSAASSVAYQQDITPPSTPGSFSASAASSSVTLSWSASTDNIGVAGYYVYRDNVRIATPSAITSTSYKDSGLVPGDIHLYSVAAYDASGNVSARPAAITVLFDGDPPSIPSITAAKAVSQSEIDISWTASSDNIGVAGYYVYRGGLMIKNVPSTILQYADIGLTPQTQYGYTVAAYDAAQNVSRKYDFTYVNTLQPDIYPPSPPGTIAPDLISSSTISLSWQSSTDNIGVSSYYVYRNGSKIAISTSTSYSDSGLTASTTYKYAVVAYDAAGNASPTSSISVTTLSRFAAKPSGTNATYPATSQPISAPSTGISKTVFTSPLYYGLRSNDVKNLQLLLIQKEYLGQNMATGFFGQITQKAVRKMQCDLGIVCYGSPWTTGWGSVGPKTIKALNSL